MGKRRTSTYLQFERVCSFCAYHEKCSVDFSILSALLSDRRQGIAVGNVTARMITRSLSRNKRKLMKACEEKIGVRKRRKQTGDQYVDYPF